MKRIYLLIAHRLLYRHIAAFHAISPLEEQDIARLFPHVQVYCLPNGPSIQVQKALQPRYPSASTSDAIVKFIYVGRLDIFTKGLDILLEVYARAVRQAEGLRSSLILVGPDWRGSRTWLEQRAQALGIAAQVQFTGPLSGSGVAALLTQADVYIQLSRYEGFGSSVAEALLAGKPAILSEAIGAASFPELAQLTHLQVVSLDIDEAAAAIADFADRLEELSISARQSQAMLHNLFSWERIAKLHLAHYEKFIEGATYSS